MSLPFRFSVCDLIKQEKTTQDNINEIVQWVQTTNHPNLQDEFIVLFLLACGNDISATKRAIEAYFRIKNKATIIFNNYNLESEDMKKITKVLHFCIIPERMNNNVVILAKLNDTNYRKCDIVAAIKLGCMLLHLSQIEEPPDGLIAVIDMKGIGFMHLTCIKMRPMLYNLEYIQEGLPLKIRDIHILNTNSIFHKTVDIFKIFIKNELIEMIKTHPPEMDLKEFHEKHLPAKHLPQEYGGTLPPLQELMNQTMRDLMEIQPFFEAEEKLRNSYKQ